MKVIVPKTSFRQLLNQIADFRGQLQMVGDRFAAEFQLVTIVIELNRRLDRLDDDGIADIVSKPKSEHDRDGARRGDGGLLQTLQLGEFGHRGAAAKKSPEAIAISPAAIELEVVGAASELKAPDLAISAILDERADPRQITKRLFQSGAGHSR